MSKQLLAPLGIELPKIFAELFDNKKNPKETVYVVGNGWGSYHFVKNLDKKKFNPIIIAPNPKVLNTPKLTNLVINPYEIVEFENPYGSIITDTVEDINIENKMLITRSGSQYNYSRVVLAIGSEPNDFGIQGVNEHALKFKTIADANLLREKLSESNGNGTIYVVGSGVTGIELGSKIASTYKVDIKMIEGLKSILPGFNTQTQNDITKWIEQNQKSIQINLNTMVKSIDKDYLWVESDKIKKPLEFNNIYRSDLIIWTGGVRLNGYGKTPLYKTLNQISPILIPRGLNVEEDFSIGKDLGIYCIGDMVGNRGPPTAQNAKSHGEWLAKYFNSGFDPKYPDTNKFESRSKGKLVHLPNGLFMESEYYNGFVPGILDKFVDKIIEWINM